jgi:hypothetical protein
MELHQLLNVVSASDRIARGTSKHGNRYVCRCIAQIYENTRGSHLDIRSNIPEKRSRRDGEVYESADECHQVSGLMWNLITIQFDVCGI